MLHLAAPAAGSPFTALCQLAARLAKPIVADLHLHTLASDGDFTPGQVVLKAKAAGLKEIAVTDHDTFAGIPGSEPDLRIRPGIELTVNWREREIHVLAYFPIAPKDSELNRRLEEMLVVRRDRFRDFLNGLVSLGIELPAGLGDTVERSSPSLGRRHVANLLVRTGIASTYREAWQKFVGPLGKTVRPKLALPWDDVPGLVRPLAGFTSLAHPPSDLNESDFESLFQSGLGAVEAKFPAATLGRTLELKSWAAKFGKPITGGSDCHGADAGNRTVGAVGLTAEELRMLNAVPVG